MLVEHARNPGGTFQGFAAMIGVHRDQLYEWAKKHPEFAEAKKIAKEVQEHVMYQIGIRGVQGKIPFFNGGPWIFMMKACHGWSEHGPADLGDDNDLEFDHTDEKG